MNLIGTFGPSCYSEAVMIGLFKAGMTGMRLNLSHIGLKDSADVISTFWHAAKQTEVQPQLIVDLHGPELRVDKLSNPIELQTGNTVILGGGGIPVPKIIDTCNCHYGENLFYMLRLGGRNARREYKVHLRCTLNRQ